MVLKKCEESDNMVSELAENCPPKIEKSSRTVRTNKKDTSMTLYLLRVGADSTKAGGGFWGHIQSDNRSYIFIPIPERLEKLDINNAKTYQNYAWFNKPVLDYLPGRIRLMPNQYYIHDDPEFQTFTYGSPEFNQDNPNEGREKNFSKLCQIEKGDMLAFYAAFTEDRTNIKGYYFFAYFIVDFSIDLNKIKIPQQQINLITDNHHFIHREVLEQNQVIVKGTRESQVLDKVVLLSSRERDRKGNNYYPCKDMQCLLSGYNKSMNRSSIRKFDHLTKEDILRFKQYLDENGI